MTDRGSPENTFSDEVSELSGCGEGSITGSEEAKGEVDNAGHQAKVKGVMVQGGSPTRIQEGPQAHEIRQGQWTLCAHGEEEAEPCGGGLQGGHRQPQDITGDSRDANGVTEGTTQRLPDKVVNRESVADTGANMVCGGNEIGLT